MGKVLQLSDAQFRESLAHLGFMYAPCSYQKAQGIPPCVPQSLAGFMPRHPTCVDSQEAAQEMFYCPNNQPYTSSDSELIEKYQMQTSPGTKLVSTTWWENTIIFPSPSIGLFRILSASCLVIIFLSVSKCLHFHLQIKSFQKYVFSYSLHEFQQELLKMLANISRVVSSKPLCCYASTTRAVKNTSKALCWMLCRCTEKTHRYSWLSIHTAYSCSNIGWSTTAAVTQLEIEEWWATKNFTGLRIWKFGNQGHHHQGYLGCSGSDSNGRPRLRTRHILRRGIIFSLWPCFVCFYAVPLASPFLFQTINSLTKTDRKQTGPKTIEQLEQQCWTNTCGQLMPFMW